MNLETLSLSFQCTDISPFATYLFLVPALRQIILKNITENRKND